MALMSVLLLAVHLLAVNVASAGPLACVWLRGRGRRGDMAADAAGRRLANISLWSLMAGVALGFILLGLAWRAEDQGYWQAVERFPTSAFCFALGELAFTAVCLAVYVSTWDRWRGRPWLHGFVAVLAATNLLYHFPPLMVALGDLAARPEIVAETVVTRDVFRRLMLRPNVIASVLHFTLASVAVVGVVLMHVARGADGRVGTAHRPPAPSTIGGQCPPYGLISAGAWIAFAASLAQLAVGAWVLVQLPGLARNGLIGDDWLATGLFLLSLVVAFGVLHGLARVGLGDTSEAAVRRCTALLLLLVVLMAGTVTRTRRIEAGSMWQGMGNQDEESFTARLRFSAQPQAAGVKEMP